MTWARRTCRAGLLVAATACSGEPHAPASPAESPGPAVIPAEAADPSGGRVGSPAGAAPVAEVAADPADDGLPHRIWWRSDGGAKSRPTVATTPGGEALEGDWGSGYGCMDDGIPSFLWRGELDESAWAAMHQGHWIWIERDGVRWWLFSRHRREDGTDPAFTDEQRSLIGRWRHREEDLQTEIELLEGGRARSREGEDWEWISGGDCLELQRPYRNGKLVLNCILGADRKSYRREDDVTGTRLDTPK